jgi:hypothetical protein
VLAVFGLLLAPACSGVCQCVLVVSQCAGCAKLRTGEFVAGVLHTSHSIASVQCRGVRENHTAAGAVFGASSHVTCRMCLPFMVTVPCVDIHFILVFLVSVIQCWNEHSLRTLCAGAVGCRVVGKQEGLARSGGFAYRVNQALKYVTTLAFHCRAGLLYLKLPWVVL